jgi:hypothetical protein
MRHDDSVHSMMNERSIGVSGALMLRWMFVSGGLVIILLVSQLQANTDRYRGYMQLNKSKVSCCGGKDCHPLPDNAVKAVPGGYEVDAWGFIPNAESQPGPDQHYHICHSGKKRYCFLIPNFGA